jgi:hypothetical protein
MTSRRPASSVGGPILRSRRDGARAGTARPWAGPFRPALTPRAGTTSGETSSGGPGQCGTEWPGGRRTRARRRDRRASRLARATAPWTRGGSDPVMGAVIRAGWRQTTTVIGGAHRGRCDAGAGSDDLVPKRSRTGS